MGHQADDALKVADEILHEPRCSMDDFTLGWLRRFPTAATFGGRDSLDQLAGIARMAHVDIEPIERRHAQVRRITELRSATSSRGKTLEGVAADFMFIRQRKVDNGFKVNAPAHDGGCRKRGRPMPVASKQRPRKRALAQDAANVKRRALRAAKRGYNRGGGGPYRVFLKETMAAYPDLRRAPDRQETLARLYAEAK